MQYCRLLSLAIALLSAPALAQSPEALDYFRAGYDLVKKGSFRIAVIELEKAVAADASYGNAHYVLGISYKALNEYDKAINSFAAAHALGTKPEQSAKALGQLYQKAALNSFRQKKYREVIDYFNKARDYGPQSAQSLYVMGLAHSGLHEKDKAKVAFAESIAADPTDARPYNALGDIQRLSRDYGKAIVTYERSIEADPTYMESYGDLARLKFDTQDIESVVPLLQNALKNRRHVRRRAPLARHCAQPARPFPRGHCSAEQGRRSRRWLLRDALPAERGSLRYGQFSPSH